MARRKPHTDSSKKPEAGAPADIERVLKEVQGLDALEKLVSKGCDRSQLIVKLSLVREQPWFRDDWESLIGFGSTKELKAATKRIRKCADDIELINEGSVMFALVVNNPKLAPFRSLPELLRLYCELVDPPYSIKPKKQRPILNLSKARLVEYVISATGRPCDREVAELISAVLNDPPDKLYSEDAHRTWRHDQGIKTPSKS